MSGNGVFFTNVICLLFVPTLNKVFIDYSYSLFMIQCMNIIVNEYIVRYLTCQLCHVRPIRQIGNICPSAKMSKVITNDNVNINNNSVLNFT